MEVFWNTPQGRLLAMVTLNVKCLFSLMYCKIFFFSFRKNTGPNIKTATSVKAALARTKERVEMASGVTRAPARRDLKAKTVSSLFGNSAA